MEFSDLALAKFLQAAPELAPSIVNFSEVTSEVGEEGEVKVGLFLLRLGPEIATVPVVGRGDTLFPIDSLFLESEAKFRPLTKSVVTTLLNAQATMPGKATMIPPTVNSNPNLNNLLNPPRTGKFIYASASRLTEFLAVLPAHVKQAAFTKISAEKSLYDTLDKMFGLKAIFMALSTSAPAQNSTSTGPDPMLGTPLSVVTTPSEVAALGDSALAAKFVEHGYAVVGTPRYSRTAVAYQPYNEIGTYHPVSPARDYGQDFMICMRDGSSKAGFMPKYHVANPVRGENIVTVFEDGSYASGELISNGDALNRAQVLDNLFKASPPRLLRELSSGDTCLMFTLGGEALGPFTADSVTRTANGVEIKVYGFGKVTRIMGSNNFTKDSEVIGSTMFVPHNLQVLVLGSNVTGQVETNVNNACATKELITSQFLNTTVDLRHDGVEYSANGRLLGGVPQTMKYLVEGEGLDPADAGNFMKAAAEQKLVKIFMSKAASASDTQPTEIPEYGSVAPKVDSVAPNGSMNGLIPALQSAAGMGDSQVMESAIIAQLLQVPDLFEYIQEYLPEIDETVDKLGRVLFLCRVKIDQLSEALDSDTVFATLAQIKNVYKQLGDSSEKLKAVASTSYGFTQEEGNLPQ
jgi:hypothetical protein